MDEMRQCELCYELSLDVTPGLAWYRTADSGHAVQTIDRCKDAEGCQARVEARGEEWPLVRRDDVEASIGSRRTLG